MSGHDLVRDRASRDFLTLSTGDDAEGKLAAASKEFGVVTDSAGHPRALLSRSGSKGPAFIIPAEAPMDYVLGPNVVGLLDSGSPGLVVANDTEIVGVLSADAIIDHLLERSTVVRFGMMGDGRLHGDAPVTPLKMTCSTCGAVNTVLLFAAGETMCTGGHPLTLMWK